MDDAELQKGALARDPEACRALIQKLSPIIHRRVASVLSRRSARMGHTPRRADILDLIQEVFVVLLDHDGRVLRAWDPRRGLSLANFVGLVAEREAGAILASGRRSAWAEDPTDEPWLAARADPAQLPESRASAREQLRVLLETLRARLTPRNFAIFEAMYVDDLEVDEVCARFETTPNAIYTLKSRIKKELGAMRIELGHAAPERAGEVA
jgi:RNA polymerase sigma factor (sigma-70 family)